MKLYCRGIVMDCRARRTREAAGKNCRVASSQIEFLEERCLLSTFTVTNNADNGPGTLRQAILNANANRGADTINFNIKVGAISEVAIPNSGPQGITTGPDGNLWFTEATSNQIGRISASGTITQFTIPTLNSDPMGITAGPDGNLWFTEESGNKIGRITPTGTITEFPISSPDSDPVGITAGPDGNLWFTQNNIVFDSNLNSQIGRITPTGTITEFPIPTPDSGPLGITAGPDGNLWITEETANQIGRITPAGAVTEFAVPTPNSQPEEITAGPDGNLWFTEFSGNQIGRITPTGVVTEFAIPTPASVPLGITAGPDGNLWFTEETGNQIGRITPAGSVTEFPVPTANSGPNAITAGPDGNLWFTEGVGNKIGRLTLASSGLTITPITPLPPITGPVTIDGTTQPGFAGSPIIEIDGASAGTGAIGLTIAFGGGNSTVQGLVINRFNGSGIQLDAGGNSIVGNFIGTDVTGAIALGNGSSGVSVFSSNNTIGGTSLAARNLISGNGLDGINLTNVAATGNLVQGNFIGTDVTGGKKLGNARFGVVINSVTDSGSPAGSNNTIGGLATGAGNVISGNDSFGVVINGPYGGATGNVVQGNLIGTDASGEHNLGNTGDGIVISSAADNTVGGTGISARNVIAGSGRYGIVIESTTSTGNLIQNNLIGTDKSGILAISNAFDGVIIQLGASNNTVGGVASGAGNLISGNVENGVEITDAGTSGNLVIGNRIGTTSDGTAALPNQLDGISIDSGATSNTIGGTTTGARNVISGNSADGIELTGSGSTANVIEGSLIGTDATGTAALGNLGAGVSINGASANTIGGTAPGSGNVISGNGADGIDIGAPFSLSSDGNLVQGNKIGTNAAGTAALGNGNPVVNSGGAGVRFFVGTFNTVANNVISGNVHEGIFFNGDLGASHEMVQGNLVGTNFDGTAAIPNGLGGISLLESAGNTISGNVISGNRNPSSTGNGINLASADDNLIQANLIGTDASGSRALPNISDGVLVSGSNNTIGGTTDKDRNVISGNGNDGVEMTSGASNNAVWGNYIGVGADGTTPLGNVLDGVSIASGATSNKIGGTTIGALNIISGNNGDGIDITGPGTMANLIQGNYIGTDVTGTASLGNLSFGIAIDDASSNTVGGTTPGAGNVISGNGTTANLGIGIYIFTDNTSADDTASGNVLQGNFIGTNSAGTSAISGSVRSAIGVLINQASGNAVQNNVISGNQVIGIEIAGLPASSNPAAAASSNVVQGNVIGTNQPGTVRIANGADGIFINDAPGNTIGGTTANDGNLVSGNGQVGIQIFGLGARRNLIENNTLGRNISGGVGRGLLNGDSGDLGIYVNTTPTINTIVGNTGQGLRDSPTGAPFNPGDPGSANGATAGARQAAKHSRPFLHRPFLRARSQSASKARPATHSLNRVSHR